MGLCAAVLVGCKDDKVNCSPPKPQHPPLAIDWEGYNNAYDVYWNYTTDCSVAKLEDNGKFIKVTGWLVQPVNNLHEIDPSDFFHLIDKPDQVYTENSITVFAASDYLAPGLKEQLREKFDNSDLTAKCYITGTLVIRYPQCHFDCCVTSPVIVIASVDDIIFE